MEITRRRMLSQPGMLRLAKHSSLNLKQVKIPDDETVIDIKSGASHSVFLCYSGRVYILDNRCDLGSEINEEINGQPILIDSLYMYDIVQIACGDNFTMFLESKGALFVLGQNSHGQLGLATRNDEAFPVQVHRVPAIRRIAAGGQHSAIICVAGKVWVAGDNCENQLGLTDTDAQTKFRTVPGINGRFKEVSCGAYHTAILSEIGVLYLTGLKTSGLLGFGKETCVDGFKPILSAVSSVACGGAHTIAVTELGEFWSWGLNNYGQLGTQDRFSKFTPTQMFGLTKDKSAKVIARGNCTAVIFENGNVYVCGEGTYGRVDNAPILCPTEVTKSPQLFVQQVTFADTYTLILVHYQPTKVITTIKTWERILLQSLVCSCLRIMSPPIRMCIKGHNFCKSCSKVIVDCSICHEPLTETRNITLESICLVTHLPCIYCLKRMPAHTLDGHCKKCPSLKSIDENWSTCSLNLLPPSPGNPTKHRWSNQPFQFIHKITGEIVIVDIIGAYNEMFNLHRKYEKNSNVFMTAIRYTGPPEDAHKFKFKITYNAGDNSPDITITRNVCSSNVDSIEDIFRSTDCVYVHRDLGLLPSVSRSFCQATVLLVE